MEIKTTLTKAEYIKLNLRISFMNWGFLALLIVVLGFVTIFKLLGISIPGFLIWVPIVIIAYQVIMPLYMGLSSKNRNFFTPHKYIFNSDEVLIITPSEQSIVKWDAFVKWQKKAGYYLIYASSITFYPVEVSSIPSGEVSNFESLLNSNIKSPTKKKWTRRMKILLVFDIKISLWWLFVVYGSYSNEWSFLAGMNTVGLIAALFIPIALLLVVFAFLISNRVSGSRRTALCALHWLLFIGMLAGTLYIFLY